MGCDRSLIGGILFTRLLLHCLLKTLLISIYMYLKVNGSKVIFLDPYVDIIFAISDLGLLHEVPFAKI
jgi:hypothetical protein